MPDIRVTLPIDTHAKLKSQAALEGFHLSAYIIAILTRETISKPKPAKEPRP